jgi:hypothetical protein
MSEKKFKKEYYYRDAMHYKHYVNIVFQALAPETYKIERIYSSYGDEFREEHDRNKYEQVFYKEGDAMFKYKIDDVISIDRKEM